ncbi:unnamed protein product [Ectocarpus sp. CCAP 1310/34]|nr:unnamed protein product [Ectocarpus sp. CCAP 1310/34]
MEQPSTVLTKFKSYKAEYTRVWLWLDTGKRAHVDDTFTTRQGTSKAKTFMEQPSTVLTKFKSYKAEYTRVWLWLYT